MAVYTLFSQAATGTTLTADPTSYTVGVQFSVSQPGTTLTGVWFYSAATAPVLPQTIALYAVSGASLVHSESASWSGAAGSGWVRAAFASPPALTASTSYKACVFQNTGADWYSATSLYWSSGAGSGGVSNGPLSAPNNAGGDGGQDTFFASGLLTYPNQSFNATNYWVDPEVTTSSAAPDVPQIAPGQTWLRLFKPWAPRPRLVPSAPAVPAVSATGSLALAPLALAGTGAQTSPDVPQAQPGPFWLRLFKPGLQRPVPPPPAVQGVNAAGSLTVAPLALSGTGAQTSPDVPGITPGPVWLRLFRPWQPRQVPPLPGPSPQAAVTSSGSLALAPLTLAGAGAQTSPDVPSVQPGPVWSRLFRPWAARPVPPPPAVQGVNATGSLALAPLAVAGQGAQTSPDQLQAAPGPFWLRLFRPWQPRPVPPPPAVPAVNAAGSLTLAPLTLSGAGGVKGGSPDQPQAQPGPVWLRLFKPWIPHPAPVNAGQGQVTITSSGGITLAPLKVSGNAEGPTPVITFGGARWKWTFGAARNR